MNDFEKISKACKSVDGFCQVCSYYSHNTGSCIFRGKPAFWEIPAINTAVYIEKMLEDDVQKAVTKQRKKRGE